MKKIFALFGFLTLVSSVSFAAIDEYDTALPELLQTQGFSRATLELVDTSTALHRGPEGNYVRRFKSKTDTDNKARVYKHIKNYFDPIQDDGLFAEHAINYSNSWKGEDTGYTSLKEMKKEYDGKYHQNRQKRQAEVEDL